MAQRRMFSPDIVCSEEFLEMPPSSRELYFQLGMRADDDGFIQPKAIIRAVAAKEDDLKVLLAKRFVLPFESGVVVIKHWLVHNMIRLDRYKPTRFQEEKKQLFIKENKAYTEHPSDNKSLATAWQPNGNHLAPQVRLGKDRIGKDTQTAGEYPEDFISLWDAYPKKVGKGEAYRAWRNLAPSKALTSTILASVAAHLTDPQWKKESGRYIPNPATYLNQRRFEDEIGKAASSIRLA